MVSPSPNSQAGGPLLVRCPHVLIQYICSYPPHLEAVSYVHNLRTCLVIVTGIHFFMVSAGSKIIE